MSGPRLTLYLRPECSLCQAVVEELEPWRHRHGLQVEEVDVDTDPALVAAYGERVPVLVGERGEICHYFFDPEALARYLSNP